VANYSPNESALLRLALATAVLMEIDNEWQTEKRYLHVTRTQNQDRIYRKTVALSGYCPTFDDPSCLNAWTMIRRQSASCLVGCRISYSR
jgi:hypothetical protein